MMLVVLLHLYVMSFTFPVRGGLFEGGGELFVFQDLFGKARVAGAGRHLRARTTGASSLARTRPKKERTSAYFSAGMVETRWTNLRV